METTESTCSGAASPSGISDAEFHRLAREADLDSLASLCEKAAEQPLVRPEKVTRVGIFCNLQKGGGLGRVATILQRLFRSIGITSVFFLTGASGKYEEYATDGEIEQVWLPESRPERWERMRETCLEKRIDTCLFMEYYNNETFFDIACAKICRMRAVISIHNVFFEPICLGVGSVLEKRIRHFSNADALTCLSGADLAWWRLCGVRASAYIPNPLTFAPDSMQLSDGKLHRVVFIGRAVRHKGLLALPAIINGVLAEVPEAEFVILGDFRKSAVGKLTKQEVLGTVHGNNVRFEGLVDDVSHWLSDAAVHIMPSMYEGAPMALMEAKAHGVPSVLFDMPYLEATGPEDGCVMVGKGDVNGMVAAIVRLLRERPWWESMSHKARASLAPFRDEAVLASWEALFNAIIKDRVEEEFAPALEFDRRLLEITMGELVAGAAFAACGTPHFTDEQRMRYLMPLDKFLRRYFPPGSIRRRMGVAAALGVRKTMHAIRWVSRKCRGKI